MAFVERGIEFLKPSGKLGFVITNKIMHTLYGSALRKKLLQEAPPIRLVDYSLQGKPVFQDATNYPLVLAVENRSAQGDTTAITLISPRGERHNFDLPSERLPLLPWDKEAHWSLIPPEVRDAFDRMLVADTERPRRLIGEMPGFQAQMGVKTGLDHVFTVRRIESVAEAPDELVIYASGYYNRRFTETDRNRYRARIERSLLRPLIRGAEVKAWMWRSEGYIVWSHDDKGRVLASIPPRGEAYFYLHEGSLRRRADHRDGMPLWQIFRVTPRKLGPKVAWQQLSSRLGAAYVPAEVTDTHLGLQKLIPLLTTYFITVPSQEVAYTVAGFLNSLPVRQYCISFAERAKGAYFRITSPVIGLIPLPAAMQQLLEDGTLTAELERIQEISRALHENPQRPNRTALETELDSIVATLYGLTQSQLRDMCEFYGFVTPTRNSNDAAEVETDDIN